MEEYNDTYKAAVSRRRKKRLQFRMDLLNLNPIYTVHFENSSGLLSTLDLLTFQPLITVLDGPVVGQVAEQPGALTLKEVSDKYKLGFWPELPITISKDEPFRLKSIDIVSGNFNNLTLDLIGFDANDLIVATQTFVTSPGNPVGIPTSLFPMIKRFTLSRNAASTETRHPNAVGTVISIGGRPRPPIYTKSVFIASISYSDN